MHVLPLTWVNHFRLVIYAQQVDKSAIISGRVMTIIIKVDLIILGIERSE